MKKLLVTQGASINLVSFLSLICSSTMERVMPSSLLLFIPIFFFFFLNFFFISGHQWKNCQQGSRCISTVPTDFHNFRVGTSRHPLWKNLNFPVCRFSAMKPSATVANIYMDDFFFFLLHFSFIKEKIRGGKYSRHAGC